MPKNKLLFVCQTSPKIKNIYGDLDKLKLLSELKPIDIYQYGLVETGNTFKLSDLTVQELLELLPQYNSVSVILSHGMLIEQQIFHEYHCCDLENLFNSNKDYLTLLKLLKVISGGELQLPNSLFCRMDKLVTKSDYLFNKQFDCFIINNKLNPLLRSNMILEVEVKHIGQNVINPIGYSQCLLFVKPINDIKTFTSSVVDLNYLHSNQITIIDYIYQQSNITQFRQFINMIINDDFDCVIDGDFIIVNGVKFPEYYNHFVISPALDCTLQSGNPIEMEVRTVVLNGRIVTASSYKKHGVLFKQNIDNQYDLLEKLQFIIDDVYDQNKFHVLVKNIPICIDFAIMKNNEIKIVELNSFNVSGMYDMSWERIIQSLM